MTNSFIKNTHTIEEDYRTEDLLDFTLICSDFKGTLEKIKKNSIIGLIGRFGSGKSTMLYQLYRDDKEGDNEKWLIFDAWKYPERKDLWEGFVLDIARQLDMNLFDQARNKIDGTKGSDIKSLINVLSEGANIFLPGSAIAKNFTSLFKTSPIRRVFELQEILNEIVEKINKNIYIIIEDIDRSGDRGIFFLETLRNFIKENEYHNKIFTIVPMGDDYYNGKDKESYLKTIDYKINFKPINIGFNKFIKNVFKDDLLKTPDIFEDQMDYFFKILIKERGLTIREIKHILRLADLRFQKLSEEKQSKIDVKIFILFETINYRKEEFTQLVNDKERIATNFWANKFLMMIANKVNDSNFEKFSFIKNLPIFLVKGDFYVPKFNDGIFGAEKGYYLTDDYLDMFF